MAGRIGVRTTLGRLNRATRPGALAQVAYDELVRVWALAAQAFVREATMRVLVDTGMSAATFFPLSRAISRLGVPGTPAMVRTAVRSSARRGQAFRDRPEFPDGHRRGRIRSARAGENLGRRAYRLNIGTRRQPFFNFFFQTQVYHFAVNDATYTRALAAGEKAFLQVIRQNFGPDVDAAITQFFLGGSTRALPVDDDRARPAGF